MGRETVATPFAVVAKYPVVGRRVGVSHVALAPKMVPLQASNGFNQVPMPRIQHLPRYYRINRNVCSPVRSQRMYSERSLF
jgi:hypothetical protein